MDPKFVEHIHTAQFFAVGARDAALRPHGCMVPGCRVDAAGRLAVFILEAGGAPVLAALGATKRIAVTVAEGASHVTYQFKGEVVDSHPVTPEESAVLQVCAARMGAALTGFGLPVQNWYMPPLSPCTTVVVDVKDVFLQTPGVGAGARVGP